MTSPTTRIVLAHSFLFCLLVSAGCQQAPKGPKVFLESEQALDKVHRFRMHIETITALPMLTDAKFACDQDLTWYQTTRKFPNAPDSKNEFVQTASLVFSRELAPEETNWSHSRRQIDPGVCDRLKTPTLQGVGSNRLITVDQPKAVPPFYTYANEQGATITRDGDEVIDDVTCEIWTIHHSASLDGPHSIWIATSDRLPRKYVEGPRDSPVTVVTYTGYEQPVDIQVPPGGPGQ